MKKFNNHQAMNVYIRTAFEVYMIINILLNDFKIHAQVIHRMSVYFNLKTTFSTSMKYTECTQT
jgi:hypothetical protein